MFDILHAKGARMAVALVAALSVSCIGAGALVPGYDVAIAQEASGEQQPAPQVAGDQQPAQADAPEAAQTPAEAPVEADDDAGVPERIDEIRVFGQEGLAAPELSEAIGAVIMDQSGTVLFEKNPEVELPLASITKVMTAMVALDANPDLNETVTLQEVDLPWDSQMAGYVNGDQVSFGELMRVMLVYSANDAAYNVALFTAGSKEAFADLMNAKARELGMTHSHFVNPHGLEDEGHYSCARDLAVMARYAMENYPLIAQTVQTRQVTTTVAGEPITLFTTDQLLGSFNGMRGVKTGAVANNLTFLGASGRGNIQLYSAVLGCLTNDGRFGDTATMMEWAYGNYASKELIKASWPIRLQTSAYDLGRKSVVSAREDFTGAVWKGEGSLSYEGLLCKNTKIIVPGCGCGWISWRQGARAMGGALYSARPVPERVSSWPIFSTALFYDINELGNLSEA